MRKEHFLVRSKQRRCSRSSNLHASSEGDSRRETDAKRPIVALIGLLFDLVLEFCRESTPHYIYVAH